MIPIEGPYPFHRAAISVFLSWFISQLIKVLRGVARERRFNFRWLFDTGGMPSSHSATVGSLATATAIYYGVGSMMFLIVLIFTIITMFDAAGVRRNMGKQASTLNKMLDEMYQEGGVRENRLKELLGHTPIEVFAGAFLGFVLTYFLCEITV